MIRAGLPCMGKSLSSMPPRSVGSETTMTPSTGTSGATATSRWHGVFDHCSLFRASCTNAESTYWWNPMTLPPRTVQI